MLKVTKIEITVDEFIKEVEALFPGKFTEAGLGVLFDKLDDEGDGEYELYKIGEDFEEWTYEKYQSYIVERYAKIGDNYSEPMSSRELQNFIYEEVYEDNWNDSVVGFTDFTIIFTSYYTSHLEYELKEMYERMRTIPLQQFCKEFECSLDSIMEVFERYKNGTFMDYDRSSRIFHLDFRGMTDKEITFEQHVMPRSMEEINQ